MWKREKYQEFFLRLTTPESKPDTEKELHEITRVASQYVIGRLISMAFLAFVYTFTIVAIVLGELVWGVAGMILFIPLFAVLRIICEHHPALHPYSFLLANDVEEPQWLEKVKGWFGKEKSH